MVSIQSKIETERKMPVEKIPVGEFVRKLNKDGTPQNKTYVRCEFDRSSKSYELDDVDDISRSVFVKKGTVLFVGFTY